MTHDRAPLTAAQLGQFKTQLESLLIELTKSLGDTTKGSQPVKLDEPIGRLSRMDAIQQQQMAKATQRGLKRRIGLVRAALSRIQTNRFGECVDCEEPIALPRLVARPEAGRCIPCQSVSER